jgi:hypothetical protein
LALYALTHAGKGPGGFVGDENDCGLALLTFLPFPFALLTECRRPGSSRIVLLGIAFVTLLGIISTDSRGDFVGLVCVLFYFFLRSRHKFQMLFVGGVLVLCALPFLPADYISEMKSIKDTSSGTAEIRQHYWKIAWRVFTDPKNILIGVGMQNTSYRLAEYETGDDLERFPSSGGRAVHSIYFEILPDLGIWGICIVGSLVWLSTKGNARNRRLLDRLHSELKRRATRPSATKTRPLLSEQERGIIMDELEYTRALLLAANLGFVAIFTAGAFISVLYYPMLWLFAGLSALLARYSQQIAVLTESSELA